MGIGYYHDSGFLASLSLSVFVSLSLSLCLPNNRLGWSAFCFVEAIMNIYERKLLLLLLFW
jgi:hypothetical protein